MSRYDITRIEYEFGLLYIYVTDAETGNRSLYEIKCMDDGRVSVATVIENMEETK